MSRTTVGVRVDGLPEVTAGLTRAMFGLEHLERAKAAFASMTAGAARARAPRRSGDLAASVTANPDGSVVSTLVYAAPIHWGWPDRWPANPFISEAAQATEARWVIGFETEAQQLLDQAA